VRPISLSEARAVIEKHEYLGSMPAFARWAFGIFFGDRLGGAVVYGDEYAENRGVWDRYNFTGRIVALKRGACLPWAHPHSASKLIRRSMDLLPERFKVVTATCCKAAGEIGTIYQACGFDYIGQMRRGMRALIYYAGKIISERIRASGQAEVRHLRKTCIGRSVYAHTWCRGDRDTSPSVVIGASRIHCGRPLPIADRLRPYPKRRSSSSEMARCLKCGTIA
jgi:hypothetical protein